MPGDKAFDIRVCEGLVADNADIGSVKAHGADVLVRADVGRLCAIFLTKLVPWTQGCFSGGTSGHETIADAVNYR
jgi:hypothetical protein